MGLNIEQTAALLKAARHLIGTPYSELKCNEFVQKAFKAAGLDYPEANTSSFHKVSFGYFDPLVAGPSGDYSLEAGDVIVVPGHMGIWDSEGCKFLAQADNPNAECQRLSDQAPFLSSRSTGNRGPEYGLVKWWTAKVPGMKVYRWKR